MQNKKKIILKGGIEFMVGEGYERKATAWWEGVYSGFR
jgi:hypothetical protein